MSNFETKPCQCSHCGRRVDYLVDDGICQNCFEEKED